MKSLLVLLLTFSITFLNVLDDDNSLLAGAENLENNADVMIRNFLRYVDAITDFKLNNMLKISQEFTQQLLNAIPYRDRGNTAQLLQNYIDKAENLRYVGATIAEKENCLLELHNLINMIRAGFDKGENEDIILKRELVRMFTVLARLTIEESRFVRKFSKSAKYLETKMPDEAIQYYSDMFNILHELDQEQDIAKREPLMKQFKEVREHMLNY